MEELRIKRSRYDDGMTARTNMRSLSGRDAALMEAKRSGALPGFIGRLGSLGSIPKK